MSDASEGQTYGKEQIAQAPPSYRFEKYADAVAAKAAFEEVYPPGSSIEIAVRGLVELGVQCKVVKQGEAACRYVEAGNALVKYVWHMALQFDNEKSIVNVVILHESIGT